MLNIHKFRIEVEYSKNMRSNTQEIIQRWWIKGINSMVKSRTTCLNERHLNFHCSVININLFRNIINIFDLPHFCYKLMLRVIHVNCKVYPNYSNKPDMLNQSALVMSPEELLISDVQCYINIKYQTCTKLFSQQLPGFSIPSYF